MKTLLPLVSVVMPSLNQVMFIEQAIDSVLTQSYTNIELIVADGGSDDGTLELLTKKQQQDSRLKWFSKKDSGPANAINKALLKSRGTIIGWLNSDDKYNDEAILEAVSVFRQQSECLLLYGQGYHIDEKGKKLARYPTLPLPVSIQAFKQGCFICQPTVFFQRSVFILLGSLDENLKTAFDFDYWLRAFSIFPERIGFIDRVQAFSRLHSQCITRRMRRIITLESMQILTYYLGNAPSHWLLSYLDAFSKLHQGSELLAEIEAMIEDASDYISSQELIILSSIIKKRLGLIE
jgi:glycosyltransferase involved in cell wall biosynthesis